MFQVGKIKRFQVLLTENLEVPKPKVTRLEKKEIERNEIKNQLYRSSAPNCLFFELLAEEDNLVESQSMYIQTAKWEFD